MNNIKLLDCTLRDGGYVVDTVFGDYVIKGVLKKLINSKIDVIEIGYIKDGIRKEGSTTFSCFQEILEFLPSVKPYHTKYAVMIEYNKFDLTKIITAQESKIDIIRICFFKNDRLKVMEYAQTMMNNGYEVYLQPMNTLGYSDFELLELIEETNKLCPKALYIVDSFGSMYPDDLERIYSIMNHNLKKEIYLGLHSHNNLQLSFMLVQNFVQLSTNKRNIVVDASCQGIGRGAGNACTELVVDYLIRKQNKHYDLDEILDILDRYISVIRKNHEWGYSIPYFISGMYDVHVNNISYLLHKHTLKAKDMRYVISCIDKNSENRYDYDFLENTVINYLSNEIQDNDILESLSKIFCNKKVLLLAPGTSITTQRDIILNYIEKEQPLIISVNSVLPDYSVDFAFFSNKLRYEFAEEKYFDLLTQNKLILTSNIKVEAKDNEQLLNYNSLIQRGWKYFDNSTVMCLNLMSKLNVSEIALAGFDGYKVSDDLSDSYFDKDMQNSLTLHDKEILFKEMNEIFEYFVKTHKDIKFYSITKTIYHHVMTY